MTEKDSLVPFVIVSDAGEKIAPCESEELRVVTPAESVVGLLNWSTVMTVRLGIAIPAVADEGIPTKSNLVVPAALTEVPVVPVIVLAAASVAVTVLEPAVYNVTENKPVPLVSPESAGRVAAASDDVVCTLPV